MKFYIYILFAESSDIYYVGYTTDVENRLLQHNLFSEHSFTSKHRPWKLICYFEVTGNEVEAMEIEKFIKKQKSRKFIEKIIDSETELTGLLARDKRSKPSEISDGFFYYTYNFSLILFCYI